MKRLRTYKADLLIVAGFILLPLLLYGEVTLGGRTMLPADNLFQWAPWATAASQYGVEVPQNSLLSDLILENYAWKRFVLSSVRNGELPLWNPHLFAGVPFLATGQHAAYYPFSLLFLILPLPQAYGWYTVSQLWLAGVTMYVFGRVLGLRRAGAALAGLVYQGCGFMVVSAAVFPMIIGAAVWLPLLLASIEKVIGTAVSAAGRQSTTLLWAALGAMALGTQILAGHIEITYYTLLVMAAYAVWRLLAIGFGARRHKVPPNADQEAVSGRWAGALLRPSGWLLTMVVLGLMLGAVQLIPFYEVGQVNFRQGAASLAQVQDWAFPPRRILTLLLPNFFGNPAHHAYVDAFSSQTVPFGTNVAGELNPWGAYTSSWGFKNYVEGGIYLGILPLSLAGLSLYAAWRRWQVGDRRWHVGFFALLSLLSLAFIFGTPLYAILYYGLPFASQLHTPFRWVFPLSLSLAVLAGFGADYLAQTRKGGQRAGEGQPAGKAWASDKSAPAIVRPFFLWGRPSLITALAGLAFWGGLLLLLGLFASRLWYGQLAPLIERLFLGLARAADAFPSARAFYSYQFRQIFVLGLMLVATGTVLRVSRCPIFVGWRGRKRPIWELMAAVVIVLDLFLAHYGFNAAVDPALVRHQPELVQWLQAQPGQWRLTTFAPQGDKPLNANAAWLFDLQDIRGYDSIIPRQYASYMAAIEPQNELQFNRVQPITNWKSLNSPLLDVLGVKYVITAESIELPKLQLAWQGEGLRIYENLAAAPRAYTLPQGSIAVVDDPLAALTEFDPRHYVVVDRQDLASQMETASSAPPSPEAHDYAAANIESYGNIEVVVETGAVDGRSWLILNDSYFPGWKAFLRPSGSGEEHELEADIVRVNGNFRGVYLDPAELARRYESEIEKGEVTLSGRWTVRFRYSPLSFKLGGLVSFMGGIVLLFALGVWGWRRAVSPDVELTTTRSIAKNSVAPMVSNLFNKVIDFGFAAFYLRLLGPADAGSYANAIAIAGFFEIVSNFGLNILLIREVSQDRSQASRYLLNTSVLRLGTALVGSVPVFAFIWGTRLGNNPLPVDEIVAITLIMVGMVFSGMAQGLTGLFYVHEKAEIPAATTTVTTILKVAFGVLVLLLGFGFVGLAAVSILVNLVTLAILAVLAGRNFTLPGPWRVDWQLQGRMLRMGYPLMLIHLLQTVFISIDVVLLRLMLANGETVVGWYNSAYKWFNALQIVPSFFTLALFPVISREIKRSIESARRMYRLSLKLMLLLALPVAAVTFTLAYPLVGLVGGQEFLPHGAIALQIVIWSIPIGWLNSVTNYVLIALGMERMQPRAFAIAVGFNVVANVIFIPAFDYVAASVTTILSEVVLMAVFAYYLRRRMPALNWLQLAWRPLLVTAVMVLAMVLGSQVHLALGLLLGAAVYPLGLWLLRVFGEEERHVLRSILPAPLAARLKLV